MSSLEKNMSGLLPTKRTTKNIFLSQSQCKASERKEFINYVRTITSSCIAAKPNVSNQKQILLKNSS